MAAVWVVQPITLAYEGWGWIVTGFVAWASYKLGTWAGFALCRRGVASETNAPMLLLLRVFALGRRSERFFDAFRKVVASFRQYQPHRWSGPGNRRGGAP